MTASLKWHNEQDNTFVSAGTTAAVGTNAPLGANGAFASGNLIIATISVEGAVGTISPPSGTWNLLDTQQQDVNGNTVAHFWILATGSESLPFNFTWTGSNFYGWGLLIYEGNATSSPIDVASSGLWSSGGTTDAVATSISPTGTTDLLLGFWSSNGGPISGPPSGMIERVDVVQESTTISYYVADQVLSASGATGNRTVTVNTFAVGTWLLVAIKSPPPSSFSGYVFNVGQNSNPPNTKMVGY